MTTAGLICWQRDAQPDTQLLAAFLGNRSSYLMGNDLQLPGHFLKPSKFVHFANKPHLQRGLSNFRCNCMYGDNWEEWVMNGWGQMDG